MRFCYERTGYRQSNKGTLRRRVRSSNANCHLHFSSFLVLELGVSRSAPLVNDLFNQARVGSIVVVVLMLAQWILQMSENSSTNPATAASALELSDFESVQVTATWRTACFLWTQCSGQ